GVRPGRRGESRRGSRCAGSAARDARACGARVGGRGRGRGRRRGAAAARRTRGSTGGEGLRPRRRDPRPARPARLGGPRLGRRRQARAEELRVGEGGQIIYGRRPVEEAERGKREVRRVWRAPETSAEELERLCGSPDHQGVVAEIDPYPYVEGSALL